MQKTIILAQQQQNSVIKNIQPVIKQLENNDQAFKLVYLNKQWHRMNTMDDYFKSINRNNVLSVTSVIKEAQDISELTKQYKTSIMQSYVVKWSQVFNQSLFESYLYKWKNLVSINLEAIKFNQVYLVKLYEARWLPYPKWKKEENLLKQIVITLNERSENDNTTELIDEVIFEYYTRDKIEAIKESWGTEGIAEHLLRILDETVRAYHREEYALTMIVLSTLWEGIIYDKCNDNRRRVTKLTKENFNSLIARNDVSKIVGSYYEEVIVYQCCCSEDVKEDVPGRHSSVHGFFKSYPSRKAALNAILFTDLLLWMD